MASPESVAPKPSQKVLDELTKPKQQAHEPGLPSEEATPSTSPVGPTKPVQADRSIIEGLMGQSDSAAEKDRGNG